MTGLLGMSFFAQNCILTMLRFQKNPENNVRDLTIGFSLVGLTYLGIGNCSIFEGGFCPKLILPLSYRREAS